MSSGKEIENEVYNRLLNTGGRTDKKLRSQLVTTIFNIFSMLSCGAILAYSISFSIPPQIIPVNENGSYFETVPLNESIKNEKEIKQWYIDALIEAFDYNYRNMEIHPAKISYLFTPDGLRDFDKHVNASNFAKKVRTNYGIVEIVLDDKVTLAEGQIGDRIGWQVSTKGAVMIYIQGRPMRVGVYEIESIIREEQSKTTDGMAIKRITMKEI